MYNIYVYICRERERERGRERWMNTKKYSVTSEPSQCSSRRVSSFKDSSTLLNI